MGKVCVELGGRDLQQGPLLREKTLAEQAHDARLRYGRLIDEIEEAFENDWPWIDRAMTDWHDNSLEIYFEDHVAEFEANETQLMKVWQWGFYRFWLNFKGGVLKGGTEKAYLNPQYVALLNEVKNVA